MVQTFKRLFLRIDVHDNRVEVREGMFPFVKRETIPLRNVAAVEVSKFTRQLVIKTNDGKEHKYAIGGFSKAQRCRDAITEHL